jgi:hypothetical protein
MKHSPAAAAAAVTAAPASTTNNQHIDLAAAVHSERVAPNILERVYAVIHTPDIHICDSRPAARVNAATTGRTQEAHYLTRMMS